MSKFFFPGQPEWAARGKALEPVLNHESIPPTAEIECVADAKQWIDALVEGKKPCVLPEQAYCVTRILEGIYESAKTGKAYIFE